ncbi:MAG TPA: NAD(P)-dependent oxidoreductase, partial [Vicinamibacterales bacterium]|nr:NAD(P)-dependent oxidoreductase [Vicinamibacterales bacterium]
AHSPDVIVNCAAYTDVDGAEDDPATALERNAFGVLALARAAAGRGATLIHYSTDFVFDGTASTPYSEEDAPNPRSTYALSKLLGEWFAADAPSHYVLRVESLFGGTRAKSSIDRILDALREGRPARVFFDRTVTPSYVADVADASAQLLRRGAPFGLYHCVNTGSSTWQGVAEEAVRLMRVSGEIVPVSVKDVPLRASRPQYCALSNDKLRSVGIAMPTWQDALARYIGRR